MNVFDFDNTIYEGDSSVDFFLFCLRRHPSMALDAPGMLAAAVAYKAGRITKTRMKERFFSFLGRHEATAAVLDEFWDAHVDNVKGFYLRMRRDDDVVVSASPEFLLKPVCARLGIRPPIASRVSPSSGRFDGENCWGPEKVGRFRAVYPDAHVEAFYSDSRSDAPLAALADQAWLVRGPSLERW